MGFSADKNRAKQKLKNKTKKNKILTSNNKFNVKTEDPVSAKQYKILEPTELKVFLTL